MKKQRILFPTLIALVCLLAVLPLPAQAAQTETTLQVTGTQCYNYAYQVVEQVNALRAEKGLSPLTLDAALMEAAMQRAAECAVYYSHTRPNGKDCFTIYPSRSSLGENIAARQTTPERVMSDWTNSSGHYANMTDREYSSIGVGCFYAGGTYYWVQSFASGRGSEPERLEDTETAVSVSVSQKNLQLQPAANNLTVKIGRDEQITFLALNAGTSASTPVILSGVRGTIKGGVAEFDAATLTVTGCSAGQGVLSLILPDGSTAEIALTVTEPFQDVTADDWFYEPVRWAVEHEIISGVTEDRFGPHQQMNRAMLAVMLYRLEGEPAVSTQSAFTDVPSEMWYSDAITWAGSIGVINGYGNGKFGPDGSLTREQMAAIVYRYAQYKGCDLTARADLSRYEDARLVSDFAVDAVQWANACGLLNGTSSTTITPAGQTTRAQAVTILMRLSEGVLTGQDGSGTAQ